MSTPNRPGDQTQTAAELQLEWDANPRWDGVRRDYTADDVIAHLDAQVADVTDPA